jgi:Bacterial protein of unknown function (DUF899)
VIVYHFMLGPGWEEGCPSCSFLADHFDGAALHLAHRDDPARVFRWVRVRGATVNQRLLGSFEPSSSGEFVSVKAGKSEGVCVPQAAVNSTVTKYNALAAPPMTLATPAGQIPDLVHFGTPSSS